MDAEKQPLMRRTSSALNLREAVEEFMREHEKYVEAKGKRDKYAAEAAEAYENRLVAKDAVNRFTAIEDDDAR